MSQLELPREQDGTEALAMLSRIATTRRSIRAFRPTPLAKTTIAQALEVAARTPSNCNVQPWLVHVVSGVALARLREALVEAASAGAPPDDDFASTTTYPGVYRTRQVETAALLYGAIGVARHDAAGRREAMLRNFTMFDAPHAALLLIPDWAGPREIADVGAWGQTFMLALAALEVGSIPQAALGLYPAIVREQLGLDASHRLLYGISFGQIDHGAPVNSFTVGRAALAETATFHD
jgi:nitroreductase